MHRYDVLRSARCCEHWGLEPHTPFADKTLVNFVMCIQPKYKRFGEGCLFPLEKMLLRIACQDLLPAEIIWRPKMAFSDGVSKKEKSWHLVIRDYVNQLISDEEFQQEHGKFTDPPLKTKEAYWYRKLFNETLGNRPDMTGLIQEYWMPRFIAADDPSARVLGSH